MSDTNEPQQPDMAAINAYFTRGKVVLMTNATHPNVVPFNGKAMRIIMADQNGSGVLVAVQNGADGSAGPVVLIPFDGTETFNDTPGHLYQFTAITPETPAIDLNDNSQYKMGEFYADYFVQVEAAKAAAANAAPPAAAPGPAPIAAPLPIPTGQPTPGFQPQPAPVAPPQAQVQQAPVQPQTDWSRVFYPDRVFTLSQTGNAALARYRGIGFKSLHAGNDGVLAVPCANSGMVNPVFFPFNDPTTEFTLDPPGSYQFANGINQAQVYSPVTGSYVYVADVCPYYVPPPIIAYDPWDIPLAVGVGVAVGMGLAYDPYWNAGYVDPGYGYYDGYYW